MKGHPAMPRKPCTLTPEIRAARAANGRKAAAVANAPENLVKRVEKVRDQLTDDLRARLLVLSGVLDAEGRINTDAVCEAKALLGL